MAATPYFTPGYWASRFFSPFYAAGGPIVPPTIGAIAVSTDGHVDTITFPAPTAGSNAVAGVHLHVGSRSGGQSPVPALTFTGAGAGSFVLATAVPGTTHFYTVVAFDVLGGYSAYSNEVSIATPRSSGTASTAVGGLLSVTGLPSSIVSTATVGTPTAYWGYFPAAGNYALAPTTTGITITQTNLLPGGLVVGIAEAGRYELLVSQTRTGVVRVTVSPLP